ncbi:hypothetical protein CABS01_09263 [Colletotrichum abscissum]|uniref:uncharacterized protein n=1 Tax=Colletotrichum abscissum TaxID=1671311 RepID=UPI0027D64BCE|nr:uncharacterized protein CABS01_09263 [Colletotrichum abscissum]KAK1502652.1 hypothetical protein CABS01_09263 [Colletotrichum abscissum]
MARANLQHLQTSLLLPAACSHPSHPSLWESSSNPTRTNPVLAAKHEAQITTCPYSVPTHPCNASAVQTAVNPTPWPIWYTLPTRCLSPRTLQILELTVLVPCPPSFERVTNMDCSRPCPSLFAC